jgi:nickel-dependent lactate racemase
MQQPPPDVQAQKVRSSLLSPIGSPRLKALAAGRKNVTVIISDHTRPVPSKLIIPPLLEEIRAGNPHACITLLVATGCHRPTTGEELREKLGDGIFFNENIAVHDCDDHKNMVDMGCCPPAGGCF